MGVDYAYKSYVLREHQDLLIKQKRSFLFEYGLHLLNSEGIISYALKTKKEGYSPYSQLEQFCVSNGLKNELNECIKINRAERVRTKRLKERINNMLLDGPCVFLTLTFADSCLMSSSLKQRRVYVSRYLKSFKSPYVANIDYGAKNHREHYHAVLRCDSVDFSEWRKYGNVNSKRIHIKNIDTDKTKLAKYVCKLSNHAVKETTQRSCLIYSR